MAIPSPDPGARPSGSMPLKLPPLRPGKPPSSPSTPTLLVPDGPADQSGSKPLRKSKQNVVPTRADADAPTLPPLPMLDGLVPPPLPSNLTPPPLPVPKLPELEPWSAYSVFTKGKPELDFGEEGVLNLSTGDAPPPIPNSNPASAAGPGGPSSLPLGELGQIGPYVLRQLIGEGGMGLVYRAEAQLLRRPVALKVMKPEIAADERAWKLFLTEAQATASLKDDRIATIYQIGEEQGQVYLAMELLKGESLEARLKRGPVSMQQALWIVREAALGLKVAHNAGFVHRDIKPANLWLETESKSVPIIDQLHKFRIGEEAGREAQYLRVKILDFGLVRLEQDEDGKRRTSVVGTPAYMAPEQAAGRVADTRSDIFSLGVVMFRLLTGRLPFDGETSMEVLTALATKTAPLVSQYNPEVPGPLVELVQKMLSRDPMGRPASASDVARLLDAIEKFVLEPPEKTKSSKRGLLIGAGVIAFAVLAFAGWWFGLRGGSDDEVPSVAALTTKKVLEPREACVAIGDLVTVEFDVGAVRRIGDLVCVYEHPPNTSDDMTFRVALPPHIIGQMRRRGSPWPDALDGARLCVHGTVAREGHFAQLLISDLEQIDKILYKERPAGKVERPKSNQKKPKEELPGIGGDLPPTEKPMPHAPDPNMPREMQEAVKRAARDMLAPFMGGNKPK